ncbi:MAG TPA: NlpC/P60 family protein [Actinomycetes bacterium]|nr:NlpC/P60 family protein [Actinomycetes bacterium]
MRPRPTASLLVVVVSVLIAGWIPGGADAVAAPTTPLTPLPTAVGWPTGRTAVRSTPDVDALEQRADALRDRLHRLDAKADWTHERLAYAQDQLAQATTTSISADEQLQELQGYTTEADLDLLDRVKAIEQSGGTVALYSQALNADAITDVTSNVAALEAVLTTDVVNANDAAEARDQMALVRDRLHATADERARLTRRIERLSKQADALVEQQRRMVQEADADVAHALRVIERQEAREQAALTTWTGPIPSGPTPYAEPAIAAALSVLGAPYVWGAEGPDTFDCSGLVQWSYLQAGLVLPRLASDQYRASTPVPYDQMQPGDLIVYAYDVNDESTIHHITMYIGDGQMVHAPHTGDVVKVVPVYTDGIIGTVRPGL